MPGLFQRKKVSDPSRIVDEIEAAIYAVLKPLGFKRFGRTLHRFVSGDISQIVHFQCGVRGLEGYFCVNLGIRVPECAERVFQPEPAAKKYYHEDECTIHSRLGTVRGRKETWFDLRKPSERITKNIIDEIQGYVLPAFEVLISREEILAHRKDYPHFHAFGSALLDECMIYGHLGDFERAKAIFEQYYQTAINQNNEGMRNDGHLHYLDELAEKLGFSHRNKRLTDSR